MSFQRFALLRSYFAKATKGHCKATKGRSKTLECRGMGGRDGIYSSILQNTRIDWGKKMEGKGWRKRG